MLPPLMVAAVAPLRLAPLTATINVLPGTPVFGVIPVMTGVTAFGIVGLTVKVTDAEVPPPGGGFITVRLRLPGLPPNASGITAVIVFESMNVVEIGVEPI